MLVMALAGVFCGSGEQPPLGGGARAAEERCRRHGAEHLRTHRLRRRYRPRVQVGGRGGSWRRGRGAEAAADGAECLWLLWVWCSSSTRELLRKAMPVTLLQSATTHSSLGPGNSTTNVLAAINNKARQQCRDGMARAGQ